MINQPCIQVCLEFGDEPIEIPIEKDNTVLLTTLTSAFARSEVTVGLKFRNPINNCLRAVKIEDGKFHPPGLDNDGWGANKMQYLCVFPKNTDETASQPQKSQQTITTGAQPKTVDLIVLNLSPNTTEAELRDYFETNFGSLLMVELKRDRKTGNSRRFAFIRFKDYKEQMRALGSPKHKIDGHQAKLALPDFRDPSELYQENKCFIGRVNEAIKAADLREFFSQFGDIVEISFPKKFKGYAFITFADPDVARRVCGQDFIVKGYSLCVSKSTHGQNKSQQPQSQGQQNYQDFSNDWSNGWFQPTQRQDSSWIPGTKYVTAPLNPVNHYGNSYMTPNVNQLNPMVNALSIAMSNMMKNQGGINNQYRMNNKGGNWNQQQKPNNDVKNKKKKKSKNAKKTKDELSKRLDNVKTSDGNEGEDDGEDDDKIDDDEAALADSEEELEEALKQK
ncbi:TAR DNA-binding protein 43-like isoform X1 [Chironomus tepperi]|uniref:TAR DNA-binding protein 43-like isoform X1 n=1 Tax=Chironomus tepperi TaxID=113505 RepID=UPI00391F439E